MFYYCDSQRHYNNVNTIIGVMLWYGKGAPAAVGIRCYWGEYCVDDV